MPVVNGGGSGSAITLSVDGIIVEGFTTTGVTTYPEAGIKVISNNNTISGNNASSNNHNGIFLYFFSNNNTVIGNNALNNWNGIYMEYSSNNKVIGNNASNNWRGIYLDYSTNNTISGNNASNNTTASLWTIPATTRSR